MSREPLEHWPDDKLETVKVCPVCGGDRQENQESGLVDWLSNPPTGLWVMVACQDCKVAYLSPRPMRDSIGEAYAHYYTHSSDKDDLVHSRLRQLKDFFADKYYAAANRSGGFLDNFVHILIRMIIPFSTYLDAKSRHIFKLARKPGKLLDVGCGNGEFLRFARKYGWNVVGIDFDENAVSEAGLDGLDVRVGSMEVITGGEKFDFISLSHVIEHVYDPAEFIRSCYSLLNDGGTLWLETPNIESLGHSIYKSNWRGFEPPRHLILFNQAALSELCLESGFASVEQKLHGLSGLYMGLTSERFLNKASPCGSPVSCGIRKLSGFIRVFFIELAQMIIKRRREFLTLVAVR